MKLLKIIFIWAFVTISLEAATLTIAAAANLKYALEELSGDFNKNNTNLEIKIITGASGKLTQQIMSGAPYDIFLSADVEFPTKLYDGGYATDKPKVYAYGTLVLWSNNETDLSKGIAILEDDSVKKIAIANPKTAPYGIEAINSLNYFKSYNKVKSKIVTAESISQVANFVTTKSVDVGFMAKSIVVSPQMAGVGKYIELDKNSYNKIDQAMIIVKNSKNIDVAKKFYDYMGSASAIAILKKHGYEILK